MFDYLDDKNLQYGLQSFQLHHKQVTVGYNCPNLAQTIFSAKQNKIWKNMQKESTRI